VNVHPTKLEVRLSKEDQLYDLIVEKIREAFKDRILIPQNDLDRTPKKNKVLESFEQQKMDFEKRNSEVTNDDSTTAHPSSNKDHYNTNDSE
ncbi:DNA mismatch repair protein MutL, partial [Staphylococcus hominis]